MGEYKSIDSQLYEFVGNNSSYYVNQFEKIKTLDKIISWNWAAALLSPYWFFYRKMYLLGIIMAIINAIIPYSSLAIIVFSGLMGNNLYLKHVENNIAKVNHLSEDEKHRYFKKRGGTSILSVILYIALAIVIILGIVTIQYYPI